MADTKISDLTDGSAPQDTDAIPVARSGANRKLTVAQIKAGLIVTGSTDNALLRADGTGGATMQASAVTVGDLGQLAGYSDALTTQTTSGNLTLDLSTPVRKITLDAIRQITMPSDPGAVCASLTLILDCAGFTPTWAGVTWLTVDGNAPTLSTTAGKRNVLVFVWDDNNGGTGAWLGMLGGAQA